MSITISHHSAKTNLAANVGRLMQARQVTQVELAAAAGISQGYVCKILSGNVLPNALAVQQIAEHLGTTTAKLLAFPSKKAI